MLRTIVERGAEVNRRDIKGKTPLWYAASNGHLVRETDDTYGHMCTVFVIIVNPHYLDKIYMCTQNHIQ